MRRATLLFRDATGTFYNDRWKPLFEGLLNLVLSLIFVNWMGIVGVIFATILTNLFICHVVEPYILYRYAFCMPVRKFYFKNYLYIIAFCAILIIEHFCHISIENEWLELLVNGGISLLFSGGVCVVLLATDKNFRTYIKKFASKGSKV